MDAITVRGVRKAFGRTVALNDLNLAVAQGEVHGFLGPNGAGKSTTIRALLGQLRVDAGEAAIFGLDCWTQSVAAHRRLAYVPGDVALWPGLTGGASIDVLGRLHGGADPHRKRELIDRFELDPTKRTRTYSKGNRQKVALIAALATNADLLLFDEPTSGLDPLMEEIFQRCVRELKDDGRTVLLSSHILSQVEVLCDRVSIIRRGAVIRTGTLDELRSHTLTRVAAVTRYPLSGLDRLVDLVDVAVTTRPDGTHVSFRVGPATLAAAIGCVAAAEPVSLTVQPPSLDELFLTNYRSDLPSAVAEGAAR